MIITGCDIHVFCEARHDSKWRSADYYEYNWEYDENNENSKKLKLIPIYSDRCYPLFGLLAGVKCSWFSPIDFPRGIPNDVSKPLKEEYEEQRADSYAYSWYTLKELMNWREGHLNFAPDNLSNVQKEALEVLGISYCQWQECLNNFGVELDEDDWKDAIDALDKLINVMKQRVCEEFDIYDFYGDEVKKEKIRQVASDFRIVFWFDN